MQDNDQGYKFISRIIITLLFISGLLLGIVLMSNVHSESQYYKCLYKMHKADKYDAGDIRMLCQYGKTRQQKDKTSTTTTTIEPMKKEKT